MADQDIYLAIRYSGSPMTFTKGCTYWHVLEAVYQEYQSAGRDWDRPKMLLRNGVVVVETNLADKAWNYGQAKFSAIANAVAKVQENEKPDWL